MHALRLGAESVLAEIALAHDLRVADVGRRALLEHAAIVEHDDAVGEIEHDVHVVLDDDDGERARQLLDQRVHARGFLRAHAGGRLVEQQHARLAGERERDLELALAAIADLADRSVAACRRGRPARRCRRPRRGCAVRRCIGRQNTGANPSRSAQASARLSRTVNSGNRLLRWNERAMPMRARAVTSRPVTSRSSSRTAPEFGPQIAGEQVEIGGLAGAVRADDRVAQPCLEREAHVLRHGERAERLAERAGLERDHARVLRRRRARAAPRRVRRSTRSSR